MSAPVWTSPGRGASTSRWSTTLDGAGVDGHWRGGRVDHVTVSPLTVTMDSDDTGGFSTAELTVVLKDGTEVPAACGPGRLRQLGEGAGVEVWDAYNTWELERPVEVEEIDHLLLLGEHIPV